MSGAHDPVEQAASVLGDRAVRNAPLGALTTYRVGGPAALFVEADDEGDLAAVHDAVTRSGLPVVVIGKGSNLLVADRGFCGIAVRLGDGFATIAVDGTTVRAGGATALPVLARRTAQEGLTGLEWAVGVPGSVGGAVRMNAGGHGSDTARVLSRGRVFDLAAGLARDLDAHELDFAYRHSAVRPDDVVVWAEFALARGDRETAEATIAEIVRWRREHQPGGQNCGSVFTNPPGDSAGRVIDEAGLKGFRMGTAYVSPKHANFFQADEDGSADDVLALITEVRRRVAEHAGIDLHAELQLVGFEDRP